MADTLTFLAVFGMAIMELVLLTLICIFTPAVRFFKTWLGGGQLIALIGRDRSMRFLPVKLEGGMLVHSHGYHLTDPDSVYFEKKSGKRVMIANEEVGITLSPRIMQMMNSLKAAGFDNIDEAELFNTLYHECRSCGWAGLVVPPQNNPLEEVKDDEHSEDSEEAEPDTAAEGQGDSGEVGDTDNSVGEPDMPGLPEGTDALGDADKGQP